MIHAYDENMRGKAQTTLGTAFGFASSEAGYLPQDFFALFIESGLAERFESGNPSVVMGLSGIELALRVLEETVGIHRPLELRFRGRGSKEYWIGWSLAYYQWETSLTFREIAEAIPMDVIEDLYYAYHEMDVRSFVERMDELYREAHPETNLQRLRKMAGLTQGELAKYSGVPVRTIQQYEQRQKDVNKAQFASVMALAQALSCRPEQLFERRAS
ncbi:MAG: helix-turn-helix transcriptional regulator [Eggerthellales bacterium]|nr:helix-turn-helix transcriptional regulator [Eggerthellales bacterium]